MGAKENKENSIKMYMSLEKKEPQGFLDGLADDATVTAPGCQDLLPWRVAVKGKENIKARGIAI